MAKKRKQKQQYTYSMPPSWGQPTFGAPAFGQGIQTTQTPPPPPSLPDWAYPRAGATPWGWTGVGQFGKIMNPDGTYSVYPFLSETFGGVSPTYGAGDRAYNTDTWSDLNWANYESTKNPGIFNRYGQPMGTAAPYGNTYTHRGPAYFSGYATARDFNRMGTTLEEELAGKRKPKVSYSGAWKGDKDNPFEGGNPFQGRWGNKKKKIGKGKPKGSGNTPGWVGEMAQFNV